MRKLPPNPTASWVASSVATGAVIVAVMLPMPLWATNGYIPHGIGTAAKGMAGAGGAAFPQDALVAFTNNAGVARLGRRFDVSLELFNPRREYRANDDADPPPAPSVPPGTFKSDKEYFLLPGFGLSYPLGERSTVGLAMIGHGGMNTRYNNATFERFAAPPGTPQNPNGEFTAGDPTGVNLEQLALALTYAYQLTPHHAVAISPIFAYQRFKAYGLQPFKQFSVSPANVTNRGDDNSYGGGVRVGWLGKLHERLDVGVSYQSKLRMSDLKDYEGLFAKGGKFDIPAILNAGFALELTPKLTLVGDYSRIYYSDIDSLHNDNDVSLEQIIADPERRLGGDNGLGFGWGDVDVFKMGLQYAHGPRWTFRAGYSHGDEPWSNTNTLFNVLAPATIENHASVGFSYHMGKHGDIHFAYTHAFRNTISGTSTFTGNQTGNVSMSQNDFEISWGRRF